MALKNQAHRGNSVVCGFVRGVEMDEHELLAIAAAIAGAIIGTVLGVILVIFLFGWPK